ncbi:EpsG family protein [Flavobacteriaceae bacterium SZ-1-7]|uniref:EpsG family protein n=1 Tax=Tamlana sedimenti TaxID=3134126 RepID=UPI003126113B
MIDFIPIKYYSFLYYQFILLIGFITLFHTYVLKESEIKVLIFNRFFSLFVFSTVLFYIGLRPLNGVFVDMTTYAHSFNQYKHGMPISDHGDIGFAYFLKFTSQIMSQDMFFLLCAFIYIYPLFKACKNWFPFHYFFPFLMLIGSFSFWTYGVNGMRNGMATSVFILALSYVFKNRKLAFIFFAIALALHKSMMLPLMAYLVTTIMTDTKKYYFFWVLAILLSVTMGGVWENLFASLGFGDDRFAAYLTQEADASKFSSTGFRYDFLLYGAVPLMFGYFYIFKKGYNNIEYKRILHTYIVANGFWIMVIRANFSNRFAYLSWFLMAIVIAYPLFKEALVKKQFKKIGVIILLYYGFTYAMYNVYY